MSKLRQIIIGDKNTVEPNNSNEGKTKKRDLSQLMKSLKRQRKTEVSNGKEEEIEDKILPELFSVSKTGSLNSDDDLQSHLKPKKLKMDNTNENNESKANEDSKVIIKDKTNFRSVPGEKMNTLIQSNRSNFNEKNNKRSEMTCFEIKEVAEPCSKNKLISVTADENLNSNKVMLEYSKTIRKKENSDAPKDSKQKFDSTFDVPVKAMKRKLEISEEINAKQLRTDEENNPFIIQDYKGPTEYCWKSSDFSVTFGATFEELKTNPVDTVDMEKGKKVPLEVKNVCFFFI